MGLLPGMEPSLPPVSPDGSGGDEWYTPGFILRWVGPIALDPCWSHSSLVRAAAVIDLRQGGDALIDPWEPVGPGVVFVNPPFSAASVWLYCCRAWAMRLGRVVVALVPAIPGDNPWHVDVWPYATAVGFVAGRVDFINPHGRVAEKGRGHALVLFGPEHLVMAYLAEIRARAAGHPQEPVWVRRCA